MQRYYCVFKWYLKLTQDDNVLEQIYVIMFGLDDLGLMAIPSSDDATDLQYKGSLSRYGVSIIEIRRS